MRRNPITWRLGRLLVASLFILAVACKKETPQEKEIKDLTAKAAELDKLSQQANVTGADQGAKLKEAGATEVKVDPQTLQLSDDQRRLLEERVKTEKGSTVRDLLQEVLDKDKEIKELNTKISKLRAMLPKPDVAKANDSHYGLAIKFLRSKKVKEEDARRLVSRVLLMDKLAPGFEVYHFYANGVYGTWVSQGKAAISPTELQAEEKQKIETERDVATARGDKLQEEVSDLVAQKAKIQAEIEDMRSQKAKLIEEMNALAATNEGQKAKLNSLHYVVGERKALEKDGVIVVPVFAKDRAGKNWRDDVFKQSLDLRSADTITIKASEVGLKQIGKVSVVPGSYVKDEHYKLTISEDKQTATIKLITRERFKNDKVVFAVTD